ncbi:doublecortin domain-containing protein 1-like [Gigantopelta aegis]|uniref:doublecortin domain-containing protein 1-like n=1 Tax=Gigantopelta aegis TaxID=1735272 RepID=UPI001B88E0B4|nr:doublecortin domain-containing protein 1-like [Gigantopelta aegis]
MSGYVKSQNRSGDNHATDAIISLPGHEVHEIETSVTVKEKSHKYAEPRERKGRPLSAKLSSRDRSQPLTPTLHKGGCHFNRSATDMVSYEDLIVAQYLDELRRTKNELRKEREVPPSPYLQRLPHSHLFSSVRSGKRRPASACLPSHARHSGKPKIDAKFIADSNLWDPESPRLEKVRLRNRPSSAPIRRTRPISAVSSNYSYYGLYRPLSGKKTKSLYKKQPHIIRVTAFKNGTRDVFCNAAAPNMKLLLEFLTDKLNLGFAARRIFLEDGMEISEARDIPPYAEIYVSMGEPYKDPQKPTKRNLILRNGAVWTLSGIILPENGKKKATKTKMSKHMRTLVGEKKVRIIIYRNGSSQEPAEVVADCTKLDEFLVGCTARLDMRSHARVLYDWEGRKITDLTETPILDDCLQSGGTPILGPLWVSAGEGFSPTGTKDFIAHTIIIVKRKLKEEKERKDQIDLALKDENDCVTDKAILSMSSDQLYEALEKAESDIDQLKETLAMLKDKLKNLREELNKEEQMGVSYKMEHIREIQGDDRLVGTKGLKLKIFENGSADNEYAFFFNLREALKGIASNDKDRLMQRLLDEISSTNFSSSKAAPKLNAVAQRLYDKYGHEITDVLSLEYDQKVWVSFGEPYICPFTYCLEVFFDKASKLEMEGVEHIVREQIMQEDTEGMLDHSNWEANIGFPVGYVQSMNTAIMQDEEKAKWMLEFAEVDRDSCYLLHKKKNDLCLYPELVVNEKFKRPEDSERKIDESMMRKMKESQIWVITKGGHIICKYMPQLCLAVSDSKIEGKLFGKNVSITGFIVTLQKKMTQNPNQIWNFSPEGTISAASHPELALTYLGNKFGDDEGYEENKPQGTKTGQRVYLVVSDPLTKKEAAAQRFGLKQERFDNLGQWKYCDVSNPEWHKLALSWPVKEDGERNLEYDWPMEGYLIPNVPPPRKQSKKSGLSGVTPKRLSCLKNGERDRANAISVVGPNLTNMVKDVTKEKQDKNQKWGGKRKQKESLPDHADSVDGDFNLHCHDLTVRQLEFSMFLDHCTSLLDLPFAGRRLFDEKGVEHFTLQSLKRDSLVYISCGEQWVDPNLSKTEQERRFLLTQLYNDVAKIRQYCSLRHPQNYVLEIEGGITQNARIIVNKLWNQEEEEMQEREPVTQVTSQILANEEEDEDLQVLSPHTRAHLKSEERLNSLKWPWERLVNATNSDDEDLEAQKYTDKELYEKYKPRPTPRLSRDTLQRFVYEDNYIASANNKQLVLGVHEQEGRVSEVFLMKRHPDDINQRWVMKGNGEIRSRYNKQLVLTVALPNNESHHVDEDGRPLTFVGCPVTLQMRRSNQFGRAHQKWRYDAETGFIHAFDAKIPDQEITAATKADVCTFAIAGPTKIDQPGYLAEIPSSMSKDSKEITICLSCARSMRGRYRLQKLQPGVEFFCAMGQAKKFKLPQCGSFRFLSGKVDLSTHEAELTLAKWEETIEKLREETSVRTIAKEISAAQTVRTIKILAYKNGEGRMRPGKIIFGSSIQGLLNQCTSQLELSKAARRLYMEDGILMLEMEDLIDWAVENYKNEMADRIEKMVLRDNSTLPDVMEESAEDSQQISQGAVTGKDLQLIGEEEEEVDDERGDGDRDNTELSATEDKDQISEVEEKTELDNNEARKIAKKRELLLSQVPLPSLETILRYPVEVWVSSGKKFIPPEVVESKDINRRKKRAFRAQVSLELDMEKHILRQMKGRRFEELNPGEYKSTLSAHQPVIIEGHWQEPTVHEKMKHDTVHRLQTHLGEIEANQKDQSRPSSANFSRLYRQPNLKRVMVYPNGESLERAVYVWGETLEEILDLATVKLDMWKQAKYIFTSEGIPITSFDDLERDQLICISPIKTFKRPKGHILDIEVKANWGRARRKYGPAATEVMVTSAANPKVDVDPFGPPELALPLTKNEQAATRPSRPEPCA